MVYYNYYHRTTVAPTQRVGEIALIAQLVERVTEDDEVASSNLAQGNLASGDNVPGDVSTENDWKLADSCSVY